MKYTTLEELAHSDGYYVATEPITGNELKHWKYIEKYKNSRGHWVYVYANKKTHNEIQNNFKNANAALANQEIFRKSANTEAALYNEKYNSTYGQGKQPSSVDEFYMHNIENMYNTSIERLNQETQKFKKSVVKAYYLVDKHQSTLITKVAEAVSSVKGWISGLFKRKK